MLHKQRDEVQWLEFELLAECPVIHGCLMRYGGCSTGAFESLNLGRSVGDKIENIAANFTKVINALEIPEIVSAKVCHGATVTEVHSPSSDFPISDGLSTKTVNLGICVTQADCQAAIFYDPVHHAISNVHCGWRSNVQNIYKNTVLSMQKSYGSKPQDLLVCISPSLGPESAEFINYRTELPEPFWDFQIKPLYFDLWAISEWQLKEAGVLSHHIQIAKMDTLTNDDFFSDRRLRPCGRQATVCVLKPS